ncbi:hypothetical protein LZ32DRAFT_658857 [Colletotrichum eremochloae]|nr:hypothetical protein LZ32DRAFT_658857 [Colletotrichum eremochloae]
MRARWLTRSGSPKTNKVHDNLIAVAVAAAVPAAVVVAVVIAVLEDAWMKRVQTIESNECEAIQTSYMRPPSSNLFDSASYDEVRDNLFVAVSFSVFTPRVASDQSSTIAPRLNKDEQRNMTWILEPFQ